MSGAEEKEIMKKTKERCGEEAGEGHQDKAKNCTEVENIDSDGEKQKTGEKEEERQNLLKQRK